MIEIRRATADDIETIASYNEAMALETEDKRLDPDVIRAGVRSVFDDSSRGFYLIAQAGDRPAACLMITYEWSDWRNGLFWWIQSVYVHPDFRRRGVYREMYRELKAMARDAEVIGFRLYVETDNARAQRTYASLGMEACRYRMFEEMLEAARHR